MVDLSRTNPPGFESDRAPRDCRERIVYELHIKDFSYDVKSGVPGEYRGKYKAFTVDGTGGDYPTCMEYLKRLGVTHVQLLPFFDYGSVDEAGDERQFNWGYDPVNYNVPEGSYATDPNDGIVRIRECKEMIQALHENGIGVIMDVVYNHTHQEDSWLQRMVPGYYYRYQEDGSLSNGSACGNDIAAGRSMVDNYIADSVMYWAKEYHIDGFRFDLMGLLTVELMNRIRRELDAEFGPGKKMMYGEPWSAADSPMEKGTRAAQKGNAGFLDDGVGIFCDDTRDVIKGSVFQGTEPGFVNGGTGLETAILQAVTGWKDGGACFEPKSCRQIINYVSAHDNFTLWDKLVLSMHRDKPDFDRKHEDVLAANKLAAFIYFTCQGNIFLQAGEEFGRTKHGEGNSYRSSPELNMLDWSRTVEYGELVEYYKGLIRLRKRLPGVCDKSPEAVSRISCGRIHGEGVVSFLVDNRAPADSPWEELFIVYNASGQETAVGMPESALSPEGPEGQYRLWEVLADGLETDCRRKAEIAGGHILVAAHSGLLLGRRKQIVRAAVPPDGDGMVRGGTLAHIRTDEERPYLWEKMSEIYAALGARYTAEELRETFRSLEQKERDKIGTEDAEPDLTKVFALLYAGRQVPCDERQAKMTAITFRAISREALRVYDGVEDLFQELRKRGKRIYLLSNAQTDFTRPEIEMLHLTSYFNGTFLSSEQGCKKPSPIFLKD